jgi:hypothetical protein
MLSFLGLQGPWVTTALLKLANISSDRIHEKHHALLTNFLVD